MYVSLYHYIHYQLKNLIPISRDDVVKTKLYFGANPALQRMCDSEWKWFTFYIQRKYLSFTIHSRDNALLLSEKVIPISGMKISHFQI